MIEITIPAFGLLHLSYLVLDVNGTIALYGRLLPGLTERLDRLSKNLQPCLVSADTQGTLSAIDLLLLPKRLVATLRT